MAAGPLWAAALLLAGALSFSVQPLIARMLLPRLGGAPAVWIVSLLFFQTALLLGYAYAHVLGRSRSLRAQLIAHLAVLLAALVFVPPALRVPADLSQPSATALVALAATIGLPYTALVATSPLLQHWLARAGITADPYVLYAASNAGSLAGLLAYPFILEPWLGLRAQSSLWAAAYVAAALLVAACGVVVVRHRREVPPPATDAVRRDPVPARRYLRWAALAMLPAAWLGAITTHLTVAVAPIPLLWVLPLSIYLVTLIIAFAPAALLAIAAPRLEAIADAIGLVDTPLRDPSTLARLAVAAAAVALAMNLIEPVAVVVLIHAAALFAGALACHSALAADRPPATGLTGYYLTVAAGGALGGMFAAVIAPALFDTPLEYPLVLAAFVASGLVIRVRARLSARRLAPIAAAAALLVLAASGSLHPFLLPLALAAAVMLAAGIARVPAAAGVIMLAALVVADASPIPGGFRQIRVERSFFGVNRVLVSSDGAQHVLLNGRVSHGAQLLDPAHAREPQAYYTRGGPLGDILPASGAASRQERVAVVGLGAGAMACYADEHRRLSFFEIDPTVVALAEDPALFTYLRLCPPESITLGDARISLTDVPDGAFEVLAIDAYSGDSMPVHLLTREAFALYRRVLAPHGIIALHISNLYFDLEPLVAALASDADLAARVREDLPMENETADPAHAPGWSPSVWAVVGEEPDVRARLERAVGWREARTLIGLSVWTDDYANPLAIRR